MLDTDTATFSLTINYVTVPCSPALTLGTAIGVAWSSYVSYRIGDPQSTTVYSGSSNNDCYFDSYVLDNTSFSDVNNLNLGLTYTPETLTSVTAPNVFAVTTAGQLDIFTADVTLEAVYDLRYVLHD